MMGRCAGWMMVCLFALITVETASACSKCRRYRVVCCESRSGTYTPQERRRDLAPENSDSLVREFESNMPVSQRGFDDGRLRELEEKIKRLEQSNGLVAESASQTRGIHNDRGLATVAAVEAGLTVLRILSQFKSSGHTQPEKAKMDAIVEALVPVLQKHANGSVAATVSAPSTTPSSPTTSAETKLANAMNALGKSVEAFNEQVAKRKKDEADAKETLTKAVQELSGKLQKIGD